MSSALRVWIYDKLTTCEELWPFLRVENSIDARHQVFARRSAFVVPQLRPFLIYGLGNLTNEQLAEDMDHEASRQFWQVWIHDEDGDYSQIDDIIPVVVKCFTNQQYPPANLSGVTYLETSQEFNNETYNTIFRYIRFQGIISKGERISA